MNAFDLILFDLDGTLIETAPEICDAVNDTLRQCALPTVTQQQVDCWIGQGTRELLVQALAYVQQSDADTVRNSATFAGIAWIFNGHYQQRCGTRSKLYPQVRETLQALRARGVKTAVLTNKEGRYTDIVLQAHGLDTLLDMVVSGDTLPVKKPDPAGVALCLRTLGVPRERTLLVGDSRIDVATARNAGVQVWALPYGYNMGEPIADSAPDRVIADCSALLALPADVHPVSV